ncbi:GNAT family N-acetyltransferase [Ruegeria marina]|nr:GNAT family N-acetyltransferase [Ruegeria marina]
MTTALHLARPEDLDRITAMVASFHAETGIEMTETLCREALLPLLEGIPHGCAYLIGPARAPLGYVIVSFGWSIACGGMDGFVDEIWIRPAVRRRGIASEVLTELPKALAGAGLKALHLKLDRDNETAQRLCVRARFQGRDPRTLMTRRL